MNSKVSLQNFESKSIKFDTLMQFRVKHILLVASSYDSYVLEEDGQLTDLIYNEYLELNLTITPNVRRAGNAKEALEIIESQHIDFVLIFKRVSDIDVLAFGRAVKNLKPDLPVILLAYHERELAAMLENDDQTAIDQTFVWTGDAKILLSIIKLVEDGLNVKHDTKQAGVRVIIIVEDSVKFYSSYLPLLYREIMQQTRGLMAEGLNASDKILRMRARPKILLAKTYEQAWGMFKSHKKYVLAVISDFSFKVHGKEDPEAGIKLVDRMRQETVDLPILMQSSEESNADIARAHEVGYLSKRSPTLHTDLRSFIKANFGFGDFIFTDPATGAALATARDFITMEQCIATVDEQSLIYHANRNHFSNWLMARTEFDLAARLRPRKVSEFKDASSLREYLITTLKDFRHEKQMGVIADFSRTKFDLQSDFVRIGGGSVGGKGRGLAFINALLSQYKLYNHFDNVRIAVPMSVVIGTDVFDEFVASNHLLETALNNSSDDQITKKFLDAPFPPDIVADFEALLETLRYPLAVRSSSLLEDSHLQTFAGVYRTHMLPNNNQDRKIRLRQLETAIKTIYASTYFAAAKAYHEAAGSRVEEEKMAVIVQQAVGQSYTRSFYPSFSGVALSYNYYSFDRIEPEDGVVYLALGFGKTVVEGMNCLRFSPSYPDKLPQFSTVKDMLKNSQHEFFAIDLTNADFSPGSDACDGLVKHPLAQAEEDGTIGAVCSTYSVENDRVYNGCSHPGTRIVSFAPILKTKLFPLPDIVKFLLQLGSDGLNCPVEIEFAVNLDTPPDSPREFYFLQIRPMIKEAQFETVSLESIKPGRIVAQSEKTLGNMHCNTIADIVLVAPETFDRTKTITIAEEVGILNKQLKAENRPYLLIGPGRWGTSERWLGIPVAWNQISGARVIVEAAYGDFAPDPSFGTHFFQNLTAFRMGYLTINPAGGNGSIDFDWLAEQPQAGGTENIKHIRLPKPIHILIDGRVGKGLIAR